MLLASQQDYKPIKHCPGCNGTGMAKKYEYKPRQCLMCGGRGHFDDCECAMCEHEKAMWIKYKDTHIPDHI